MKLRTCYLTILFLLASIWSFTQTKDVKLSDYALTNLRYRALDFRFSFNQSKNTSENVINDLTLKNVAHNYFGKLSFAYQGFTNNETWQKNILASFDGSTSYSDYGSEGQIDNKSNSYQSLFNFENTSRKYITNKDFFEYELNTNAHFRSRAYDDLIISPSPFPTPITNQKSKLFDISTNGFIKTGFGRIDQVSDARHAIFILNELEKEQRLQKDATPQEILELSTLISNLKFRRFFDSRLQKIYELEQLDSFLQTKNLVDNDDIHYFTTLSDMWRFGGGPVRFNGNRFTFSMGIGYNYLKYRPDTSQDDLFSKYQNYSFYIGVELKNEKPINLHFQSGYEIFCFAGLVNGKLFPLGDEDLKLSFPKINIGYAHTFGYYPNTRTFLEADLFIQYVQIANFSQNEPEGINFYGRGLDMGIALNFNYYISPRFRVSARPSLKYTFFNPENEESFIELNDAYINQHVVFLTSQYECDLPSCEFNFQDRKNFNTFFDLSILYSIF